MAYPSYDDRKKAIIEVLNKYRGEARVKTVIQEVTEKFPQLTQSDLTEKISSGGLKWPNKLQWDRLRMIKEKILDDNATRGFWKLASIAPPSLPQVNDLAELLNRHISNLRHNTIGRLFSIPPASFEKLAGKLLEALGFTNFQVTGRAGDGGIDGNGNLQMGIVTIKAAVQVKRWQNNVGRPTIDQFRGAIQGTYDQGIVITTSDFTDDAKQASTRPGTVPIVLINGQKVVDIMIEKNIGVKTQPLTISQIDEHFLNSL